MHNNQSDPGGVRIKIMEAIARSLLLIAQYNGQSLTLAPHALFSRHGDLFVSAVNRSKNRRPDDEPRLGYFKLAGLAQVELTEERFEPLPSPEGLLARLEDELILAV